MSEPTRHVSKTGGAKDLKIERYDQIPAYPLAELAARYGVGSLKYDQVNGLDNWRNGYPWSWSYRALIGHANSFWAGEDIDPAAYVGTDNESPYDENGDPRPGVRHLAAVAWHAFALLEWLETHPELDDRPSTVVARNEAGLASTEDVVEPTPNNPIALDPIAPNTIAEDGELYPLLHLYDLVRVDLEDGREIHGAITAIRIVDNKVRYDVTYGGGLARLGFVPPSQVTKE